MLSLSQLSYAHQLWLDFAQLKMVNVLCYREVVETFLPRSESLNLVIFSHRHL